MAKLRDVIGEMTELGHRREVWNKAIDALAKYAGSEVHEAEEVLRDEHGVQVSRALVQLVIDEIQREKVAPADERIREIEEIEVPGGKEHQQQKEKDGNGAKARPGRNKGP